MKLTTFAAYVALSRSSGRKTIRLLGDFDDESFTSYPSEDLRQEDRRLAEISKTTKESWECGLHDSF